MKDYKYLDALRAVGPEAEQSVCLRCPWRVGKMAPAVLRLLKFTTKTAIAGGAVYVAYDQGLLGRGSQGEEALNKMVVAVPPALHEWADYFGWQLPSAPKLDFSVCESWNWGVQKSISALSSAPSKACEYTSEGWKYMKDLLK